jgi:hypothetical protein
MKLRVKIQNRTYEVEVGDLLSRPIKATIDGQVFEVWPEEAASQLGKYSASCRANSSHACPSCRDRAGARFQWCECWLPFPASLYRLM